MTGLRGNAPWQYLSVEFWKDGKWHGVSYRHKPLPGGSDLPRYILSLSTDGFDDPREAAARMHAGFPDLPHPLEGIKEEDIQKLIADAQKAYAEFQAKASA